MIRDLEEVPAQTIKGAGLDVNSIFLY